ncbi:MAG: hypothetical protein ACK40N_00695 [Meiothermus ruber]|jgi:hypothetical protein|uniref:Uncharacterized protein n=1 Tax=Meiothermus ruber TaxID=277 RepID=A0A7C3HAG2_MEIRU
MVQMVLSNLPALLFTLALGAALLGLLVWVLAGQGAASKRTAQILWALAVGLGLVGLIRLVVAP